MESMGETWMSIQLMPFNFFRDTYKWKIELEKEKSKRLEEHQKDIEREKRKEAMTIRRMRRR